MLVTNNMENVPHTATPFVLHGFFAFFGAFVHSAQAYRTGGTKNFLDFIILMIMSSFSGVMFSLLALSWFGEGSYITLAIAGTGGFVGVEGMTWVTTYIQNKFFK